VSSVTDDERLEAARDALASASARVDAITMRRRGHRVEVTIDATLEEPDAYASVVRLFVDG